MNYLTALVLTAVSAQTNRPIAMEVTISRKPWSLAFMWMWITHPNTNADQVYPILVNALHNSSGPTSKTMRTATSQKLLKNGQRNMTKSSRCKDALRSFNKSNPWMPHYGGMDTPWDVL